MELCCDGKVMSAEFEIDEIKSSKSSSNRKGGKLGETFWLR